MPSPVLQFKRGNAASLNFGLRAGEPAVTLDTNDFYVGIDSTLANNKFYGSSRYWSKETTSKGSGVNLVEGTTNGSQYITLKSPDTLSGITTYTFPATPTDGYFLRTNSVGGLTWDQVISDFYISADSGSPDTVSTGSTITFVGGTNVNTTVTDQTITINLDDGITLTNVNATGILTAATLAGVTTVDATTKATLEAIIGSEPNTFSNLLVTGISTFSGAIDANGGATIDNIQIGVTNDNKIDTVSGVLELDSAAGKVIVQDNVEIYGNLDITGNVSVGGSSFTITTSDLYVTSRDLVVGYTTTQLPNDNTANHGGIAIASTEGTPLVSFALSGINTLPDTYKQLMWFQSGALGFQEDMFAFNYGVAIGTTISPLGTRLAVGTGITMSDTGIKATDFYATNFYGTLTGNASSADQVKTVTASNTNANYYVTFVDSHNGSATNENVYTDDGIYYNPGTNTFTTQYGYFTGNVTVDGTITGTATTAIRAQNVEVVGVATNQNYYITLVDGSGNSKAVGVDAELLYNPNTNVLSVPQITIGTGAGVTQFSSSVGSGTSTSSVPTSSAVIDYVGTQIGNVDLTLGITADSGGTSSVDTSQILAINGTANEIETSVAAQTIQIGLPSNVTVTTALTTPTVKATNLQANDGTAALTISNSTGAVTASNNLTINGDLYVNGNTTQINTTELTVEDRTVTLGFQTGSSPTTTTWDLGVMMNYGDAGVAKTAGVVWQYSNGRFVFSANSNNPASGANTTTPVITVAAYAPIEIGALWVNDCAGQSQVISCTGSERFLENITVDAGTF